jgi:hypothetical protein
MPSLEIPNSLQQNRLGINNPKEKPVEHFNSIPNQTNPNTLTQQISTIYPKLLKIIYITNPKTSRISPPITKIKDI